MGIGGRALPTLNKAPGIVRAAPKKKAAGAAFWVHSHCPGAAAMCGLQAAGGCSKGSGMADRSRRVSTSTKGPSSSTTTGGRSRGTWMGLGSAAIAACTAAILSASEFTHCRPDEAATCCSASTGSVNVCTRGRPPWAAAAPAAAGAGATAAGVAGAAATGAAATTGAATGAATGAVAGATAWAGAGAAAVAATSGAAAAVAGALK